MACTRSFQGVHPWKGIAIQCNWAMPCTWAAVTSLAPEAPMLRSKRQCVSALSGCSANAAFLYARRTCACTCQALEL